MSSHNDIYCPLFLDAVIADGDKCFFCGAELLDITEEEKRNIRESLSALKTNEDEYITENFFWWDEGSYKPDIESYFQSII